MFLIDKMIDKRIAAYQSELLTTHYEIGRAHV